MMSKKLIPTIVNMNQKQYKVTLSVVQIPRKSTVDYSFRVNHPEVKLSKAPRIIINYNLYTSIIEDSRNLGLKTYNDTLNNSDTTLRSKFKVRIAIIEKFNLIKFEGDLNADLFILSDGTHLYDIKNK